MSDYKQINPGDVADITLLSADYIDYIASKGIDISFELTDGFFIGGQRPLIRKILNGCVLVVA